MRDGHSSKCSGGNTYCRGSCFISNSFYVNLTTNSGRSLISTWCGKRVKPCMYGFDNSVLAMQNFVHLSTQFVVAKLRSPNSKLTWWLFFFLVSLSWAKVVHICCFWSMLFSLPKSDILTSIWSRAMLLFFQHGSSRLQETISKINRDIWICCSSKLHNKILLSFKRSKKVS